MKNLTLFAVPVFVVILLLAGVFVWKVMYPPAPQVVTTQGTPPNPLSQETGTKPSNPFSFLFGSESATIPTPTPASAAAMNSDLETIGDDGGLADFTSLTADASGL